MKKQLEKALAKGGQKDHGKPVPPLKVKKKIPPKKNKHKAI